AAKRSKGKKGRARAVLERPAPKGWDTSDEDEIALRRWRGRTEIAAIEALEAQNPVHGTFRIRSGSSSYEVEIRSFDHFTNSCGCIDHRVNRLGTCKHIEGVIAALTRRGAKAFRAVRVQGSARIEVFLDRRAEPPWPVVTWPAVENAGRQAREWFAPYLESGGTLSSDPEKIAALGAAFEKAPAEIRASLRVSRHFGPWLERMRRERSRDEAKA